MTTTDGDPTGRTGPTTAPEPTGATGPTELTGLTATELTAAYAAGELSPVAVTRAVLERSEAVQNELNAFVLLDHDGALEQARAAEHRWHSGTPAGPVDGVPVTVGPGNAVLFPPGVRHRAAGRMSILNVVVPPFAPEDEWLD